jgi:hypothetical protein
MVTERIWKVSEFVYRLERSLPVWRRKGDTNPLPLCVSCAIPDCDIARELGELAKKYYVTAPVVECPMFTERI